MAKNQIFDFSDENSLSKSTFSFKGKIAITSEISVFSVDYTYKW